ncbi:hypothetical protein DL766_008369 [Monosporascus sp. MC13-8B]|uniref:Uncharacterized protein n=1 Tax=Monosporascus cannonballus TaxID=155416 RepID=A0ABY0H8N0_9PEZI|nr:hypothetical protein DL763_011328 [Monosporascus cannonballus]RYO84511.1 hypothetical protein DL762_005617 [Monosporascus cannonballus]RYP19727.1 hypothetical protein DL766_008369 [Monosporascus sp. MC13-8B]
MNDTSTDMQLFLQCVENTYGKFEQLSDDEVKKWVPLNSDNIGTGPRNLWIDVFGVFNFVTLHQNTRNYKYLRLAGQLVRRVHHVLGRMKDRTSRLPGATDKEPYKGGLRLGHNGRQDRYTGTLQVHSALKMWIFTLNLLSPQADEFRELNLLVIKLAKAVQPIFVDKDHIGTYSIHPAIYTTANRTIKEIRAK